MISKQEEKMNPLGMEGIEFIEFATAEPEVFGGVLEQMGFVKLGRHRSRQVHLYRQGDMNIIVNADPEALSGANSMAQGVVLNAVAFRVANATSAYNRTIELGAWPIPTRAGAMELNIPGIHGVADSILYLVEGNRDFSIYDVDFIYDDPQNLNPPALADFHFFGVAQYIGVGRTEEWIDFYDQLFGFSVLPYGESFGVLPNGTLLRSPCGKFYLQLIAPPDDAAYDMEWDERFERLALGTPDVIGAVNLLRGRGLAFEERNSLHVTEKGALTQALAGGARFELVQNKFAAS